MSFNLGYIVSYEKFRDLTNDHIYVEGDKFPFDDSLVSQERIEELASKNNKIGKRLIRPKFLTDCSIEELQDFVLKFQIEIESNDRDEIIKALKDYKKETNKIIKTLESKQISFDSDATLSELKALLENNE